MGWSFGNEGNGTLYRGRNITLHVGFRSIALTLAAIVAILALWACAQVVLLAFAAAIVATLLKGAAQLVVRFLRVPARWSLPLVIVLIAGSIGALGFFFGMQIAGELGSLIGRLPELANSAGERVGIDGLGSEINTFLAQLLRRQGTYSSIADYTGIALGVIGNLLFVVVGGIYLALDIDRYREGVLRLTPERHREKVNQVLGDMARGLQLWLLGQLLAMLVVGVTTTIGLYLLNVPSAMALGVLAALLEFIPFLGPFLAYGAALALSLTDSINLALWVSGLYLLIQQLESNLLVPIIQQRTVDLPAALGLFALLVIGTLFGTLGFLLAIPLTVVVIVAVKRIYIRDHLDEDVEINGEKASEDANAH